MYDVSIIVPVYNSENYLRECLDSIVKQSAELEVILINDGSTDNSLSILKEYQRKYSFVILIDNEQNMGEAYSRNRGLQKATGKYIMFVDSDDWIEDNAVDLVIKSMSSCNADMMFIGCSAFDEKGEREDIICSVRGEYELPLNGLSALKQFIKNEEQFMYLCTVCYEKEFIRKNGFCFKNVKVGLGGDFILNALIKATSVVTNNTKIYKYRQLSSSVSHNTDSKQNLLKGQFEQFYSLLSNLIINPDSEELEAGVNYIYRKMIGGLRNNSFDNCISIENSLDSKAKKFIYEELTGRKKIYGSYDLEYLSGNKVIIYGAGHASYEVLQEINIHNIEVIGFAVSKKSEEDFLFGHKIYEINELVQYSDEAVVLIAANSKYEIEITEKLKDLGFKRIVPLGIKI